MADKNTNHKKEGSSLFLNSGTKKSEYKSGSSANNKGKGRVVVITPSVLVLITYILLLASKFIDVALLNRDNEYMSVIILQIMIFLLPGAIWCMLKGDKYIKGLRISAPRPDAVVLIISASLLMITGGLFMGMMFEGLEGLSDSFTLYDTFISKQDGSVSNALYLVLAYAALPAVCEEFVYRGILCHEYENKGVFRAIVISSLFFGLLHFNLANLPVYLFCGAILALVMYATRSVWGAVIAHFLYNLFGVFGQPYMATLYILTKDSRLLVIIVGIVFFLSAAIFCSEASKLYRKYLRHGFSAKYRGEGITRAAYFRESFFDIVSDPFTLACVVVYIIALFISWF